MTTENNPQRGPASPLHELVSQWRASQQGTIEDFAELDRILSEYRHEDTALAHIAARVCDEDVPMHVAADIDQIIWEQSHLVVRRDYGVAMHSDGVSNPRFGYYLTPEGARDQLRPWPEAYVVTRVTIESRTSDQSAHVQDAPAPAGA